MKRNFFYRDFLIASMVRGQHQLKIEVFNKTTLQPVAGAQIFIPQTGQGSVCNDQGRCQLTVKTDSVTVLCSALGYQPYRKTIQLKKPDLSI